MKSTFAFSICIDIIFHPWFHEYIWFDGWNWNEKTIARSFPINAEQSRNVAIVQSLYWREPWVA